MRSVISGRLGKDPELSFTPAGKAKATFTVADTEREKGTNGEWSDSPAIWVTCVAWGKVAENCAESLTKGQKVIAAGRLKKRTFAKKDGTEGEVLEFVVDDIGPSLTNQAVRLQQVSRHTSREAGLQTVGEILGGTVVSDEAPF